MENVSFLLNTCVLASFLYHILMSRIWHQIYHHYAPNTHLTTPTPIKTDENYENKYKDKYAQLPTEHPIPEDEKKKMLDKEICQFQKNDREEHNRLKSALEPIIKALDEENYDLCVECLYGCSIKELRDKMGAISVPKYEHVYEELMSEREEYKNDIALCEEKLIISSKKKKELMKNVLDAWGAEYYSNLINNVIFENTPNGAAVIMRYNSKHHAFEYYSNKSIPYRFLETVAMKYVITYQCGPIFCSGKHEKLGDGKNNNENSEEDEKNAQKHKQVVTIGRRKEPVKPKFKNYQVPENKNTVVEMETNTYSRLGVIADFNMLKKIPTQLVNKTLNMTFSDFKNMK